MRVWLALKYAVECGAEQVLGIEHFLGHDVTKQHHTLTQILMGLMQAGFQIQAVKEATPSAEMMDIPGMSDELRRPMMLLIKSVKNKP